MVKKIAFLQKANPNNKEVYDDNCKKLIITIILNGSIIIIKKFWKTINIRINNSNHKSRMNNIFFIIKTNFPKYIWIIKRYININNGRLISPNVCLDIWGILVK